MNFYSFCKILNEATPGVGVQNVGAGPVFQTLSVAAKGLRNDKKELTASAFNGLQQLYEALKILGQTDPGTLLEITRKIKSALSQEHPELARILTQSANKLIAGLPGSSTQDVG